MYRRIQRLSRDVNTGFVAPAVRYGINRAVDGLETVFSQVPDIVWDMDAERLQDLKTFGGMAATIATAASALIPESSPPTASGSRKRLRQELSVLVPEASPPNKKLRGTDWLRISPTHPSEQSSGPTNTPASAPRSTATQTFSQYSGGLRKGDRWVKNLKWFRTRLLLKARAKRRRRRSRPKNHRLRLIKVSREIDNLQRKYRRVNRTNTAYGRHLLQKLARRKSQLFKWRRIARRYGSLPFLS